MHRLNSVKNLIPIAKALGPERTRTELIPFLSGIRISDNNLLELTDDEDEVLVILAEILGGFTELVGGSTHGMVLIKLLENLACAEETVIRDQVLETMCYL